jgi:hypothetical protein
MALSLIDQVRLLIADNTPGLYLISDDEVHFLLQRNNNNVNRASLEAAKIILMNLAMRPDSQVDIFSIKGAKAAEQYRLALELFIKSPDLNPVLQNTQAYFGGVSKSDMELNNGNPDNNVVPSFVSFAESNGRYFD